MSATAAAVQRAAPSPEVRPPQGIDLGPMERIPIGEGRVFTVGTVSVAVFRQRDGRLFAVENTCPHRGGPLADGVVGGGMVICPLHAWRFNLASGAGIGNACRLQTFPIRLAGSRIVVEL